MHTTIKKLYIITVLGFLFNTLALAQPPAPKNSIQAGVDYMSLDFPDDLGYRYALRYARHLANDRLVLAATAGYLLTDNRSTSPDDITAAGNKRQRLTGDLTILFDFLKSSRHALRAGGGLSGWARQDDIIIARSRSSFSNSEATDVLISASVQRENVTALNVGWHATAEYEYLLPIELRPAVDSWWPI
ncbi:hypothetical protein [Spirosoma sp. KUDC1026]|uniref:hypothetical protein n=1 Tax=Spirosoma sp. KUDC1026 TaxID=2745947 RepID=UPI00159BD3AC|nr:hypothetical protein [Spirosoma sp. KUDC1026]QKZ14055.1 hypothetical protein HU175_16030 [Spirosoma sp. KUDC1026]